MPPLSRSQLVLMLHSVPHLGPKGIAGLLEEAGQGENVLLQSLRFWRSSSDSLRKEYGLHPESAECITRRREELLASGAAMADACARLDIRVMTSQDADFPSALLEYGDPPPVLYVHGNLGLLRERRFSVVSSTGVSAHGTEAIREFAGTLCDEGLTLVTSHNTHSYQVSGLAARSRNAPVILVLDRGLLSAFPHGLGFEPVAQARIWNLRFDPRRDLAISPFRLYDHWIGPNGRIRDRMVFSLSDVVVAVEVRPGGVMEGECEHAHGKGREVYVYAPEDPSGLPGNAALLARGCAPVRSAAAHSLLATLDLLREREEGLFEEEPGVY